MHVFGQSLRLKRTAIVAAIVAVSTIVAACTIPLGGPGPRERREPPPPQPTGTVIKNDEWVREDATDEERQADIDDCYNYALGAVARSQQIESDTRAARETSADLRGYADLEDRMRAFEGKKQVGTLFVECMQDKGYYRPDFAD
jgi:hypothetical protein